MATGEKGEDLPQCTFQEKKEKLLTWVGVHWGCAPNTAEAGIEQLTKGARGKRSQCTLLRSILSVLVLLAGHRSLLRMCAVPFTCRGAAPHRRDLQRNFSLAIREGNAQLKVG
ncbi:hypothetical protein TNCV_127961 [Trichonephila clavipes]|nr:hypothetical protein TNCV_127961 [Trichonephila clavipes]